MSMFISIKYENFAARFFTALAGAFGTLVKKSTAFGLLIFATSISAQTERESILNNGNTHVASWAYYTDPTDVRWYISPIVSAKVAVYSLGPMVNRQAGWWTVGQADARIDVSGNRVSIDPNLDNDPLDSFYDVGLRQWLNNASIHSDRKKIQGTTVSIKWWFFNAPNGFWYIVNAGGATTQILKFSELNGQYDWKATDTADVVPEFSNSGNTKLVRFTSFGSLRWPVGFTVAQITSLYGDRVHPITGQPDFHEGIDFGVSAGTSVRAAAAGIVVESYFSTTYGNTVIIFHGTDPNGRSVHTLYAHNEKLGDSIRVSTGQEIAKSGSTGDATGPHVHYEIHVTDRSKVPPLAPRVTLFFERESTRDPATYAWPALTQP